MTEQLYAAIQGELRRLLKMPVWMEGCVPSGTQYPYASWFLEAGDFGEIGSLRVTCWHREDHAGCVASLSCLRGILPPGGAMLRYPGGLAVGYAVACAMVRDGKDKALEGARLRAELRVYEQPGQEEEQEI